MADNAMDVMDAALATTEDTNGHSEAKEVKAEVSESSRKSKSDRKEDKRKSRSRSRDRKRRKRSSSKDKKRSRSRDRKRSRSRERRKRSTSRRKSRSPRRRISRSPLRSPIRSRSPRPSPPRRRRSRSRSRDRPRVSDFRDRRGSRSPRRSPLRSNRSGRLPGPERRDVMPFTARKSPPKGAKMDMTAEERDQRTVFILQIARQTRPRDLEDFFSAVGNVRDVRIITDSKTGRSKGICYVEFWEEESVPLALALSGQKLLSAPLIIQRTCAERNRAANVTVGNAIGFGPTVTSGRVKLQISSLHPSIDESMLSGILEPFGKLEKVEMSRDPSGSSKGFAFATFKYADDATKALEQLNGFELAGRAMKVTTVDEEEPKQASAVNNRSLDSVADEKQGIALGQGGRIQLMAKLAQGSGMDLPPATAQALAAQSADSNIPAIATQCFMLSNMFDPTKENESGWAEDVKEDVVEECAKNGGALHVYVDQASPHGNVYVKCPSVAVAFKSVNSLHGRWFSGKVITANYVPVNSYHDLFPDAQHARVPLVPGSSRNAPPPPAPIPPPPPNFTSSFY